jgi:hypothetical protein
MPTNTVLCLPVLTNVVRYAADEVGISNHDKPTADAGYASYIAVR